MTLRTTLMKTLRRREKRSDEGAQPKEDKPLRIRGGCISTASLDDPTSKNYKRYAGHGFEMWGSHMGDRLEHLGRSISRGGEHYIGPVLQYYQPPSTHVVHHHYHQCTHDHDHQKPPSYQSHSHSYSAPQHIFRGWGGAAVDGFEHKH